MENVVAVLEGLQLDRVCRMLFIPDTKLEAIKGEFTTGKECLRAVVMYWLLRDPLASWRRLISQLDLYSAPYLPLSFLYELEGKAEIAAETAAAAATVAVANSICNYAEKLTGK